MTDPYAADARYYDAIHGEGGDDAGLWLSFAGRTERPVLELGTGTGRIALVLAEAGHRVVAVDPSPAMLAIAREKVAGRALPVEFVEGRVPGVALEAGGFGFALVPADVFLYCESGEAQLATLGALREALHFNGLLALDLPGPAAWLDATTNGQPLLVFSGETDDGERFDAWQLHDDDLAAQVRNLRVTYERLDDDGLVRRTVTEHSLRYVGRFESEYLLALAGMQVVDVYGDYDLGPLTNESERMIVIARRRDG